MSTNNDVTIEMKLRKQAGIALHKCLVYNDSFPCCMNCTNFELKTEICQKFKSRPPIETLMFSCGVENWEAGLPF